MQCGVELLECASRVGSGDFHVTHAPHDEGRVQIELLRHLVDRATRTADHVGEVLNHPTRSPHLLVELTGSRYYVNF